MPAPLCWAEAALPSCTACTRLVPCLQPACAPALPACSLAVLLIWKRFPGQAASCQLQEGGMRLPAQGSCSWEPQGSFPAAFLPCPEAGGMLAAVSAQQGHSVA